MQPNDRIPLSLSPKTYDELKSILLGVRERDPESMARFYSDFGFSSPLDVKRRLEKIRISGISMDSGNFSAERLQVAANVYDKAPQLLQAHSGLINRLPYNRLLENASFLAHLAWILNLRGFSVLFIDPATLVSAILKPHDYPFNSETSLVERAKGCHFICLSNLGMENTAPAVVNSLGTFMVQYLQRPASSMIITTTLSQNQLTTRYSPEMNALLKSKFVYKEV